MEKTTQKTDRRGFMLQTGVLLSASVFASLACSEKNPEEKVSARKPDPDDFESPALKAIAYGMSAPNPHNTQAWKFRLVNDQEFFFYADEKRLLPATDPTTRQIHIGCGCFLGAMRVGMSSKGYAADIHLLPEGEYGLRETGTKPVALVKLDTSKNAEQDPLSGFLQTRRTNRLAYSGYMISNADFQAILSATKPGYCAIRLVREDIAAHLDIHYQGMEVESKTYATYEESRIWFRENDERIAQERDGINLPAGGTTGISKWVIEKIIRGLDPKTWHSPSSIEKHLSGYQKKIISTSALVQFITPTNTQTAWLEAGMDYIRFQLAAAQAGYYLHPLSQVLQEYKEMVTLRTRYEALCGISAPEKMQMVVRIGKAKLPFESYRRDVKSTLKG